MRRLDVEVDLAELSHRLVTRPQLRHHGLSDAQIRLRIAKGVLHPVIPGVFSLDPPSDDFITRAVALCLRCPDGFVSGAAAARYWGLRRGIPDLLEFTVAPRGQPRGVHWALLRYSNNRDPRDIFLTADGLRVSTPARAVFESAMRLDEFGLRSMVESGLGQHLFDLHVLEEVGSRLCQRGRHGSRLYRRVCEVAGDRTPVDSEEELRLLDALHKAGISEAVPQQPVRLAGGFTVHLDVGIPTSRLGLEVDGPTHDDPIAVHRDKARDRQVTIQGWHVLRVTTEEIRRMLRAVTAQVLAVHHQRLVQLGRPGSPDAPRE